MNEAPLLSVVIPWCNRDEIQTTLSCNDRLLIAHHAELLIANCGGSADDLIRLLAAFRGRGLRHIQIPTPRFNKCLAINLALYFSKAPRFFVLDTDVILKADFLDEAMRTTAHDVFFTVRWVSESDPGPQNNEINEDRATGFLEYVAQSSAVEFGFRDGTLLQHVVSRRSFPDMRRRGGGLMLVNKEHLIAVKGYDSRLEQWGWEDDDVQIRLRRVLSLNQIEIGNALHLSHGDNRRALYGESRDDSDRKNFILCCRKYHHDNLFGTYLADVAAWKDRISHTEI